MQSNPFSIDGKRVVVAGGGGAIGAALCETLLELGASVFTYDLEFRREVAGAARYTCRVLDGLNEDDVSKFATEIEVNPVDALVCVQGVTGQVADSESVDLVEFRRCLASSVDASAIAVKYFCRSMKQRRQGAIVMFSSTAGERGNALMPAYTAAKHGTIGLTRSYARELGPWGIRVNAILPGLIESPMAVSIHERLEQRRRPEYSAQDGRLPSHSGDGVPLRRAGRPVDVALAAVFLISDAAAYCNGVTLSVDGGLLTKV